MTYETALVIAIGILVFGYVATGMIYDIKYEFKKWRKRR